VHDALNYSGRTTTASPALPDKPVVISEAGWATTQRSRHLPENTSQDLQAIYYEDSWRGRQ